ncbi:MAG: CRTAC1 family protein [Acidobacteriota bacterium]|jgi:hypothetical protein
MSKSRLLGVSAVTLSVILIAGVLILRKVNADSLVFFHTGKAIGIQLGELARHMKAMDADALAAAFDDSYSGRLLGLTRLKGFREKDGLREYRFIGGEKAAGKQQAVSEWMDYLRSFEQIEAIHLYVDKLEEWDSSGDWVATVRFEALGTPRSESRSGVDRAYFRMRFSPSEPPLLRGAELVEGGRLISSQPQFVNVAHEAGIDFQNQYYPGFLEQSLKFAMIIYGPGGITAVDYDNDGYCDLFIPDGVESKLFHNNGDGTFSDVTKASGLAGLDGVSVGIFADYDNDGDEDCFISRTFQHNQIFRNDGNGHFTDVTAESGIGEDSCTTVASWADYNNDGYLDLYVGRYLDPRKRIPTTFYARNGEPNQLYRNNGDGTFTNVTDQAGVGEIGLCLGTVFGDYNDDGWPDLYVVNDFGRNTLYRNNGDGTFTDVTVQSGTLAYGAGMNATFGDYDNDGRLDLYVTNIRSEYAWFAESPTIRRYMYNSFAQGVWLTDMPLYFQIFRQSGFGFVGVFQQMASGNSLLRNKGDGTFEDVSWKASANPPGWFWGAGMYDFDNDGWKDIYAADGWVYNDPGTEIELDFLNNVVSRQAEYKTGMFFDPDHFGQTSWHGWEHNRLLRNNGDGTFVEIGRPSGTDLITNSRGVAVADFWNRGSLDIAVSASSDHHALLKNEVGGRRHWFAVELVGTNSNRDAVGARVTIHADGKLQMREVVLGDGYGSQSTLRQYFGVGNADKVDELTVRWPKSKTLQTFRDLQSNRVYQVTEGDPGLRARTFEVKHK